MDPATLIGFVISVVALLAFMIMEGSDPMALLFLPAIILVIVATFGAAIAGSTMDDLEEDPRLVQDGAAAGQGAAGRRPDRRRWSASPRRPARRACSPSRPRSRTSTTRSSSAACRWASTAPTPRSCAPVLEGEIAAKKAEDKVAAKFFNAMGGYAPTIGIVGCIVGLINVMENLSNPASLGPMIAAAFVATLWGVMAANFWFLPMGAKILRVSELQAAQMELLVEGITEIQAGTSPRAVRQKLTSLVPPSELAREAA